MIPHLEPLHDWAARSEGHPPHQSQIVRRWRVSGIGGKPISIGFRLTVSCFLDETWIKTNMTRLRGWFRRGTALVAKVPHGHWKTLTFIGTLRQDKIVAPCVFDGPINANTFTAWVQQSLVPVLKPGDVVVLDNLGSHKDPRARRAIRAAGAHLLFLPPYSPDLNPIEMVFAKLKTLFRKADSRTVEEAWRKIGTVLDLFSPEECAAYISHAGYGSKTT